MQLSFISFFFFFYFLSITTFILIYLFFSGVRSLHIYVFIFRSFPPSMQTCITISLFASFLQFIIFLFHCILLLGFVIQMVLLHFIFLFCNILHILRVLSFFLFNSMFVLVPFFFASIYHGLSYILFQFYFFSCVVLLTLSLQLLRLCSSDSFFVFVNYSYFSFLLFFLIYCFLVSILSLFLSICPSVFPFYISTR